jgi:hypothetical protein
VRPSVLPVRCAMRAARTALAQLKASPQMQVTEWQPSPLTSCTPHEGQPITSSTA